MDQQGNNYDMETLASLFTEAIFKEQQISSIESSPLFKRFKY